MINQSPYKRWINAGIIDIGLINGGGINKNSDLYSMRVMICYDKWDVGCVFLFIYTVTGFENGLFTIL